MSETKPTPLSRRLFSTGFNVASFGVLAAVAVVLRSSIAPVRRGFFCDDLSIKYPVIGQTVKTTAQLGVTLTVAAAIFGVTEFFCCRKNSDRIRIVCLSLPAYIIRIVKLMVLFVYGIVATSVLTDVLKVSVGMLRPNFLAICQPNISCTLKEEFGVYHTDYVCQGISIEKENSARSSFPSAHASNAAFAALYLVLYLQSRLKNSDAFLFLPFVQLSLVSAAAWTSMTRVSDYVHHPTDVLAGLIIGVGVGVGFGLQTIRAIRKSEDESSKMSQEGRQHLASVRSEVAADISPNGQV